VRPEKPKRAHKLEVRVQLFAWLKEAAGGASSVVVRLPEHSAHTAGAVLAALSTLLSPLPDLASRLASCKIALNDSFAELSDPVHPGDSVSVIPPVSGG
jgi:molybdopterin converting factor small subunit